MMSFEQGIVWANSLTTGIDSFIGFVQLYSDKSSTFLKYSSITSCPLHLTLFNFCHPFCRKCISYNLTLVGYIPTFFQTASPSADGDQIPQHSSGITWEQKNHSVSSQSPTSSSPASPPVSTASFSATLRVFSNNGNNLSPATGLKSQRQKKSLQCST